EPPAPARLRGARLVRARGGPGRGRRRAVPGRAPATKEDAMTYVRLRPQAQRPFVSGAAEAYQQRRPLRAQALAARGCTLPTVAQIADTDNLLAAYYDLRREAGQSPGPDGVTYARLGPGEVAEILRAESQSVRDGTYQPQPGRKVPIPKPDGGKR